MWIKEQQRKQQQPAPRRAFKWLLRWWWWWWWRWMTFNHLIVLRLLFSLLHCLIFWIVVFLLVFVFVCHIFICSVSFSPSAYVLFAELFILLVVFLRIPFLSCFCCCCFLFGSNFVREHFENQTKRRLPLAFRRELFSQTFHHSKPPRQLLCGWPVVVCCWLFRFLNGTENNEKTVRVVAVVCSSSSDGMVWCER